MSSVAYVEIFYVAFGGDQTDPKSACGGPSSILRTGALALTEGDTFKIFLAFFSVKGERGTPPFPEENICYKQLFLAKTRKF